MLQKKFHPNNVFTTPIFSLKIIHSSKAALTSLAMKDSLFFCDNLYITDGCNPGKFVIELGDVLNAEQAISCEEAVQ